jgi:hypothetical protein
MKRINLLGFTVTFATGIFSFASISFSQAIQDAVRFDISPPLRSLQPIPKAQGAFLREHRVKKLPPMPTKQAAHADLALQATATTKLDVEPVVPFDGVGQGNYGITSDPPDTNGSVGSTHYVQWVNTGLAIFDKQSRQLVYGPVDGNLLWSGFGGNCETFNDGDPIVLYDKAADRWLLTQFAISKPPFSQCVAVSTSSDPTGTYARYEYQYDDFNDYPKFGVWPDAYYGTFNMFRGNSFLGSKACAFERAKMISGTMARMQCFDIANQGGVLPSDLDGKQPPPKDSPNYMMNFGTDQLNLWKFHVDWLNPTASTLSGPSTIKTAPFEIACRSASVVGECISQPNTTELLDTLSDRLMFRLAYRNFGDHDSLVVNHAVSIGSLAGLRWYELRDPGSNLKIFQQGTYAPDAIFRWMGSMAMDKVGNILIGYSVSGPHTFPAIRFSGRSVNDPANQLAAEQQAVLGMGSQNNPERWGDYASMSVDPSDDCTFWFTTQYLPATGGYNWRTSIVPVRFTSCK